MDTLALFLLDNTTHPSNSTTMNFANPIIRISVASFVILLLLMAVICLVVLILSCIYCRKQPLQSRGCTNIALIIVLLFGGGLSGIRTLLMFLLPGIKNSLRCYFDAFVIMPIFLSFISLLIARNVRFVFILNINWFKNILFGNNRISELLKEKESLKKKKKAAQEERRRTVLAHRKSVNNNQPQEHHEEHTIQVSEEQNANVSKETQTTNQEEGANVDGQTTLDETPTTTVADTDDTLSSSDEVAVYFETSVESTALKRLKFLKFMTSYWITFGIVIVVVILWYIFAILYMGISMGNDPNCYLVTPGINFACSMILYGFSFFIILLDLLLHMKDVVKCRIQYLLCTHDKFLFRIEFLLIAVVNLIIVFNNVCLAYIPQYFEIISESYPFIFIWIAFIIGYSHIFALAGFVLLVTIIWDCKHRSNRKNRRNQKASSEVDYILDSIINDSQLQSLFREFCVLEWSIENLLCYQDISLWQKRSMSMKSKLRAAVKIYEKYIATGCSLEINISNSARDKTKNCVQQSMQVLEQLEKQVKDEKSMPKENPLQEAMQQIHISVADQFSTILKEVKCNLHDTLFRFTISPAFKQHSDAAELKENMLAN